MLPRITVDDSLTIVGAEAATEYGPFADCPGGGAATFARLAGTDHPRRLHARGERASGGVAGCTHIRELLQQMATVAFQTSFVHEVAAQDDAAAAAHRLVNTCHAYSTAGPVVHRRWPALYTGPDRVRRRPS